MVSSNAFYSDLLSRSALHKQTPPLQDGEAKALWSQKPRGLEDVGGWGWLGWILVGDFCISSSHKGPRYYVPSRIFTVLTTVGSVCDGGEELLDINKQGLMFESWKLVVKSNSLLK